MTGVDWRNRAVLTAGLLAVFIGAATTAGFAVNAAMGWASLAGGAFAAAVLVNVGDDDSGGG